MGLRSIFSAVLQIAAVATGNPWLYAAAIASSAYDAKRTQKKARNAARESFNASLKDRLEMVERVPAQARSLVLGRVRTVEGVRRSWVTGTNSEKLTLIVSFAGHEIDAFETIYFDDVPVTLDGSGYVQTAPWLKTRLETVTMSGNLDGSGNASVTLAHTPAGTVSAMWVEIGPYEVNSAALTVGGSGTSRTLSGGPAGAAYTLTYQRSVSTPTARVRTYLGTGTQSVGGDLAAEYPGKLLSTDHFRGIALAVVDLTYDPDVYPQGRPNVTAVVRGAKVLDPRSGLTVWSENPALHAHHYARLANGWNVPAGEIRTADVIAAADVCDVATVFTLRKADGSTVLQAGQRYTCGLVIPLDGDPREAMDAIVETMAGRWGWAGGTLRMRAGAMAAPVWAMDASWPAQRLGTDGAPERGAVVRITNGVPRERKVNAVTARCTDREQRWQVMPVPAVRDATLIAAEGAEYLLDVQYEGVTDIGHAQHLASIAIRESQAALRMEVTCSLSAYRVELFDVGTVTLPRYGMSGKTMECIGWRWSPTEGVTLRLAEITAAIFEPAAELVGRDPAPNSDLPRPTTVATLGGLAVASGTAPLTDTSILTRAEVTWTASASAGVRTGGQVEVQWLDATQPYPASGEWPSQIEPGSATRAIVTGLRAGVPYLFRARFISGVPYVRGDWSAQVLHSAAGVPLVQTEGVEPGAISGVLVTSDAAATNLTASGFTEVLRLNVAAQDVATEVNVDANGTGTWDWTGFVGPLPPALSIETYLEDSLGGVTLTLQSGRADVTNSPVGRVLISQVHKFTLPANTSGWVRLMAKGPSAVIAATVTGKTIRGIVLKR